MCFRALLQTPFQCLFYEFSDSLRRRSLADYLRICCVRVSLPIKKFAEKSTKSEFEETPNKYDNMSKSKTLMKIINFYMLVVGI